MSKKQPNNIVRYLDLCTDVPLSVDPFSEVDALVLCELIYADLSGVVPPDAGMSIREVRDEYFRIHPRPRIKPQKLFLSRAPFLMDDMVDRARFGSMTVSNYVRILDENTDGQMTAVTYLLDDGTAYVCYSGTDKTVSGWKEDFNFIYMDETEGQRLAVEYLKDAASRTDRPLRVGGHSKGANFAVFASAFAGESIQDRIVEVYTFEGPGFQEEIVASEGYRRIVPKVISLVPETSIIGQLLSHGYPDIVVESSEKGILQHDGFTWVVGQGGFVRTELSETAKRFREAQEEWLSAMDDEAREAFVTILFAPFEAAKENSLDEFSDQVKEAFSQIVSSMAGMSRARRASMGLLLKELIRSEGARAWEKALAEFDSISRG